MIHKPIFVVGAGRSGSTKFFEMLAKHPNLAWLSSLSRDYPASPSLNRSLMYANSTPIIETLIRGHWRPSEAYPFWESNCPGFSNPFRDLRAEDVLPVSAKRLREAIGQILTKRRSRFVAKITGWPRIGYLDRLFGDALFVEVVRDGRAVASSLLDVPFWDGWRGPGCWRRGPLPEDLEQIWRQEGGSFVALAAIDYLILQRAMKLCREKLPRERFITVEYPDLCANPVDVFRDVSNFCELAWSAGFERAIRQVPLVNRDDKWHSNLTDAQKATLERTLKAGGNERGCANGRGLP